jgi:hypothetical protein
MSDEQNDNPDDVRDFYAPVPYPFFDALIGRAMSRRQRKTKIARTTITSGSCLYTFHFEKTRLGSIYLRTTVDNQTAIEIHTQSGLSTRTLQAFLADIWAGAPLATAKDKVVPSIADLSPSDGVFDAIEEGKLLAQAQVVISRKEPRRGASVDTWLDWRAAEAKLGNRVTLEYIAEKGKLSLSTLKKKSAERNVKELSSSGKN